MDGYKMDAPSEKLTCIVCKLTGQKTLHTSTRTYEIHCKQCGKFKYSSEATYDLNDLSNEIRPIISEWIYEQNELGIVPTIMSSDIPALLSRRRLTFRERSRRFLIYLSKKGVALQSPYLDPQIRAVLQTYDDKLIEAISNYLIEEKLIKREPETLTSISLTTRGLMQAEDWGQTYVTSRQGFVAMWFNQSLETVWNNGFHKAIEHAGYFPKRIDKQEHINKICDEIIAEIRRSKFVVADFTGQRGGVYFEAGYATRPRYTCHLDMSQRRYGEPSFRHPTIQLY